MLECEFGKGCVGFQCQRPATMFYFAKSGLKFWVCVKHYDDMADHYRNQSDKDEWSREMVQVNGW